MHLRSLEVMETFDVWPLPSVEDTSAIDEDMGPILDLLLCHLILKGSVILSALVRERSVGRIHVPDALVLVPPPLKHPHVQFHVLLAS